MRFTTQKFSKRRSFERALILLFLLILNNVSAYQALPEIDINTEYSNRFGLVINPKYTNLFDPSSALAYELAFGTREFRMGATWAKMFKCNHQIKLTAEYLSENILFNFTVTGSNLLWNEQFAVAADYRYLLFCSHLLSSYHINIYHAHARDEALSHIFLDANTLLYRNVSGSDNYGLSSGFTLRPWQGSRIDIDVYYDDINYRSQHEPVHDAGGLGVGIKLAQVLHPRILFGIEASHRELYDYYLVRANWLIPIKSHSSLELSLIGQYLDGDLPQPQETRIGIMLSYQWNIPHCYSTYLDPTTSDEDILEAATKPAVRMPQVFVARDQFINHN